MVDARLVREPGLTVTLNSQPDGDYYWGVRVIRVDSDNRFVSIISPESSRLLLRWSTQASAPIEQPTDTPPPPEPTDTPPPDLRY